MTTAVQDKFLAMRKDMNDSLIERDEETTLVLTALLAGEHVVLIGPPGTAKTMLAETIVDWIDGKRFSMLLNDSTKPDELFGPVSVLGMKADDYYRIIENTMLDADVVLLDEIFKGSSMILNTTLKVLNEGTYRNGSKGMVKCPLKMVIGCSNEYPREAKELAALFDRFMFRKTVNPVSSESSIERLMSAPDLTPQLTTNLPVEELDGAKNEVKRVEVRGDVQEASGEIRRRIRRDGVVVGDRRLRKTYPALQAFAYLNGRDEVTTDDLELLQHMWWSHPDTQGAVADAVVEIARPSGLMATQMLAEAKQVVDNCDVKDLAASAIASKKLGEIKKGLNGSSPREKEACELVNQMLINLRLASLDAVQ